MIPTRSMYGRIRVPMRAVLAQYLIDLFDHVRLQRAHVPPKQATKAHKRAKSLRFYNRFIRPEYDALIADMKLR